MTLTELMVELKTYNMHEQIYVELYNAGKNPADLEIYLKQLDKDLIYKENILIPQLYDIEHFTILSEESVFKSHDKKNISMQKHNRYTPIFIHEHQFFELIYVLTGSAVHEIDQQKSNIIAGDLLILSPGVRHSLAVFDDSIIIEALIKKSTFSDRFFEFLKDNNILSNFFLNDLYAKRHNSFITFHTNKDAELEALLLDMFLEHYNKDSLSHTILNNSLMIYFAKLVRKYSHQVELPKQIGKSSEKITLILNYIQEHYQEVSLSDIAKEFHFAPPYVSALIKEMTGDTFINIVKRIKLNRAQYLLLNSNLSIGDICDKIGYANTAHFIRLFKQRFLCSPTQYRKNNLNIYLYANKKA